MLRISKSDLEIIKAHASASYPHECCGILLGTRLNADKTVSAVIQANNLNTERAADRYLLDPKAQFEAERLARSTGREILGFYHSHPDHPARPSDTDNEQSWPEYSYLILKVASSGVEDMNCYFRTEHFNLAPKHKPALIFEEMETL